MQVGIDVGATKIESVVLEKDGQEKHRSRISCPKNYTQIITAIRDIHKKLEEEFKQELPIGVCHPGVHSPQTGLVKNVPNISWLEKKPFQNDLRKALGKEVFCENDANCFALSEAIDGAGKHYKIVYGIILGSGVGGGLVIDKKIVSGPNGVAGEWGHNQIPYFSAKKENLDSFSVWGTGEPLREFLYVDDLSNAIAFIIQHRPDIKLLNVGSGKEILIKDLVMLIKDIVQFKGEIKFDHTKPDGNPRKLMDSSKLQNLGWRASINLEEGLKKTYDWYIKTI